MTDFIKEVLGLMRKWNIDSLKTEDCSMGYYCEFEFEICNDKLILTELRDKEFIDRCEFEISK